jgi:hypothetical protein
MMRNPDGTFKEGTPCHERRKKPGEAIKNTHQGRDAQGRFAVKNTFGRGQGVTKHMDEQRKQFAAYLKEGDLKAVYNRLVEACLNDDIPIQHRIKFWRLFLEYTVGYPEQSVKQVNTTQQAVTVDLSGLSLEELRALEATLSKVERRE